MHTSLLAHFAPKNLEALWSRFKLCCAGMLLIWYTATCCNTLQHAATHCNTLQHTVESLRIVLCWRAPYMVHCNALQHTTTHCNTLQHTATHCSTLATHCNTLQHNVEALQIVLCWYSPYMVDLQCVAECCSVLQCVAICCNMLQCVAECCRLLQSVAECCSVLKCAAV